MSFIKDNGAYQEIQKVYTKSGGIYTEAENAYQKTNGNYVKFYEKSTGPVFPSYLDGFMDPTSGALTALGNPAGVGDSVATWNSQITKTGTVSATQADTLRQPVIEDVGGELQMRFNGGGDNLSFGIIPELDLPAGTSFTIIFINGTGGTNRTYFGGSIQGSSGQFALAFTATNIFFHDGVTFRGYGGEPAPTTKVMWTLQHDAVNNRTIIYKDLTETYNVASTRTNATSTRPFLLGSRISSDGDSLNGSIRKMAWSKTLMSLAEITDFRNNYF